MAKKFCVVSEMLLTDLFYQHKEIRKYSWVCPGRRLKSIIDYIIPGEKGQSNEGKRC